ncbi:unnamed protein product [Prorocentrum cordatum]|uniref:Uncharacterized protein n=1 Tax=Prorocentrum cordatum TaxID=2364126 RepID=A0ABN9SC31_9DINO|nr:unnamed protein product [Polarella glacialis]
MAILALLRTTSGERWCTTFFIMPHDAAWASGALLHITGGAAGACAPGPRWRSKDMFMPLFLLLVMPSLPSLRALEEADLTNKWVRRLLATHERAGTAVAAADDLKPAVFIARMPAQERSSW